METKTENGRKNSRNATPDLLDSFGTRRRMPGRPRKPALTALQLADCFEAEAKKLQDVADILRGKA